MSDGFADVITRANAFFTDLRADNTRAFYEAHKAAYISGIRKPAELLADLFAEYIARATGKPHAPKVFRLHRDVRFSRDKTPYNAHLHVMWSRPVTAPAPAFFFGASPDYVILGMGVPKLEGDSLQAYRALVDRHGDDLTRAMAAAQSAIGARLGDWGPDPLKRVPKPFDPDHRHADLLKRKSFTLTADVPANFVEVGLLKTLDTLIRPLLPVWSILDETFPG